MSTTYEKKTIDPKYKHMPWIEKYRPRTLENVILTEGARTELNNIIETKDIPNLIITGPPGIGKTTTMGCLARYLYGSYAKDAVLELNASDDRGIKSVQNDVESFCKKALYYRKEDEGKYANHKLIILDEGENITDKAQHLISKLMEDYHVVSEKCRTPTRFAFTCNASSGVIESIQSRCKILRYVKLTSDMIVKKLEEICEKEKIEYNNEGLISIATLCQGDMRHAINLLQLVYNKSDEINAETVNDICEKPQPIIIKEILQDCLNKKFKDALEKVIKLKRAGYSGIDIVLSIFNTLKLPLTNDISDENKMKIIKKVCDYSFHMSKGMDTDIQLTSCIAELCRI